MYETRLRAVLLVLGLGLALLAAGLFQLQIVEGGRYRTEAQHRLIRAPGFYPTVRGAVYDRNGVSLARDTGAYDVAIYYPFIDMDEAFTARMAREWGVAPEEARNRVARMWPALAALTGKPEKELLRPGRHHLRPRQGHPGFRRPVPRPRGKRRRGLVRRKGRASLTRWSPTWT